MSSPIKHVVMIMLENHSFDNFLGFLYSPGVDDPLTNIPALKPGEPKFHGPAYATASTLANEFDFGGVLYRQEPVPTVRATNSPGTDPGEEWSHVNTQLFGSSSAPTTGTIPGMKGFLQDYSQRCTTDPETIKQLMHCYTPADLPVLNTLAKNYAVCDMWFSSVPTQTNANRAFSICGTSKGLVNNGEFTDPDDPYDTVFQNDKFKDTDTIFNMLEQHGFTDWAIFCQCDYPPFSGKPYIRNMFPNLETINNINSHFHGDINDFLNLAKAGQLPFFSYIEPKWGGAVGDKILTYGEMGNDYHPPSDVTPGEITLGQIYESLRSNRQAFAQTLLIIVFDEHGGTYDHVPPPWGATPPGRRPTPFSSRKNSFRV